MLHSSMRRKRRGSSRSANRGGSARRQQQEAETTGPVWKINSSVSSGLSGHFPEHQFI